MPGARLLGEAWISISPDTTGFEEKLRRAVSQAARSTDAEVEPGLSSERLVADAEAAAVKIREIIEGNHLDLPVSLNSGEALTDTARLREAIQAVLIKAFHLDVSMDDTKLLAQVAALRATATRQLTGLYLKPEMDQPALQAALADARKMEQQLDAVFKDQRIPVRLDDAQLSEDVGAERARLDALTGKLNEIRFHADDAEAEAAIDALLARADALDAKTYRVRVDADLVPLIAEISALGAAAQAASGKFTVSPDRASDVTRMDAQLGGLVQGYNDLARVTGDGAIGRQLDILHGDILKAGGALKEAFSENELAAVNSQLARLEGRLDDIGKKAQALAPTTWAKDLGAELSGSAPAGTGVKSAGGSLQGLQGQLDALAASSWGRQLTGELQGLQGQMEKLRADAAGMLTDADAAAIVGRYARIRAAAEALAPTQRAAELGAELAGSGPGGAGLKSAGGSLQDLQDQLDALAASPWSGRFTGKLQDLDGQLEKLRADAAGMLTDADAAAITGRYARIEAAARGVQDAMRARTSAGTAMQAFLLPTARGPAGVPGASAVDALGGRIKTLAGQGLRSGSPALVQQAGALQKQMATLRSAMGSAFSDADWAGAVQQFGALSVAADAFEQKVTAAPRLVTEMVGEVSSGLRDVRQLLDDVPLTDASGNKAVGTFYQLQNQALKLEATLGGIRTRIGANDAIIEMLKLETAAQKFRRSLENPAILNVDIVTATARLDKVMTDMKALQGRAQALSRVNLVNADKSQGDELATMSQALADYWAKAQKVKSTGITSTSDIENVTALASSVKRLSGAMDTLDGGVTDATKRWGGLINAMLSVTKVHIPLFNGALTTLHLPNFLASASGLHLLVEAGVEFTAIWGPAIAGVAAFALATAQDFKAVYAQFTSVKTIYQATGQALGGLTAAQAKAAGFKGPVGPANLMSGSLSQLLKPQVWTLYGELITGASKSTGNFGSAMQKIGQTFDQLGQKIVDTLGNSRGGFKSANSDIQNLATSFTQLGKIAAQFLKAVPGYAAILLSIGNTILKVFASIAELLGDHGLFGKSWLAWVLLLHGGVFYIGLLATGIGTLGKAITGGLLPAFRSAAGDTLAFASANKEAAAAATALNDAVDSQGVTKVDRAAFQDLAASTPAISQVYSSTTPEELQQLLGDTMASTTKDTGAAAALTAIGDQANYLRDGLSALDPAEADLIGRLDNVQKSAVSAAGDMGVFDGSMLSAKAKVDALVRAGNTDALAMLGRSAPATASKVDEAATALQVASQRAQELSTVAPKAVDDLGKAAVENQGKLSKLGSAIGNVAGGAVGIWGHLTGNAPAAEAAVAGVAGAVEKSGSKFVSAGKAALGWVGSLLGFSGAAGPIAGGIMIVAAALGFVAYKALTAQSAAQQFTGTLESALKAAPVSQFSDLLSSNFTQVASHITGTGADIQQWAKQWEAATGQSVEGTVGMTHALAMLNTAAKGFYTGTSGAKTVPTAQEQQINALGNQAKGLASNYAVYQQAIKTGNTNQASFNKNLNLLKPIAGSAAGAIAALTVAGVTNNQMLDTSKGNQQLLVGLVASVTAGYSAMTYGIGGANGALEALNVTTSSAYTSVQSLTGAYSTFLGIVTGSANAFTTFENQFLTIAEATGKSIPGASTATAALLKAATTATASTTASTSKTSSASSGTSSGTSTGKSKSATSGTSTTGTSGTSSRSTSGTSAAGTAASNLTTAVNGLTHAVTNSTSATSTAGSTNSKTSSNTGTASSGTSSSLTHPGNKDKTIAIGANGRLTGGGSNALVPSDAFNALTPSSLASMQAYIQQLTSAQQLFAALQTQATISGNSPLAQYSLGKAGKDITAQLAAIPGVGQGSETTSMLGSLASEMGYKGSVTDFKQIQQWAGSATSAESDLNKQQQVLTISSANLAADADALSKTMNTQLSGAMSQAIFDAEGGQKAMNSFAGAVKNFQGSQSPANFTAMQKSGLKVAQMLVTMTGSTVAAKGQFMSFMALMGVSPATAQKLWASYNLGTKAAQALGSATQQVSGQFTGTFQQAFGQATQSMKLSTSQANLLWEKLQSDGILKDLSSGQLPKAKGAFDQLTGSMHLSHQQAKTLWDMMTEFNGAKIKSTVTVDIGGAGTIQITETGVPVPYAGTTAGQQAAAKAQAVHSLFSLKAEGGFAKVGGGWGGGDRIPALLEPGELVVPKRAVPAFAGMAKRLGIPGFDSGGVAGGTGAVPTGQELAGTISGLRDDGSTYVAAVGKAYVKSALQQAEQAAIAATAAAAAAASSVKGIGIGNLAASSGYQAFQVVAAKKGWSAALLADWVNVEMREAGFSLHATNPSSGAYGMAQFINGAGEYAQYGGNATSYIGQAVAMANYISQRYGTPAGAWAHERSMNWYGAGLDGVFSRPTVIGVGERGPERVQVTPLDGGTSARPLQGVIAHSNQNAGQGLASYLQGQAASGTTHMAAGGIAHMASGGTSALAKARAAAGKAQQKVRISLDDLRRFNNLVGNDLALVHMPGVKGIGPHRTAAGMVTEEAAVAVKKIAPYQAALSHWTVLRDAYDKILRASEPKKKKASSASASSLSLTALREAFAKDDMTAAQKHAWHLLHEKHVKPHATGGIISEPVSGIGLRSGIPYSFAESGAERVSPIAGSSAGYAGTDSAQVAALLMMQNHLLAKQNKLLAQQPQVLAKALGGAVSRGTYRS